MGFPQKIMIKKITLYYINFFLICAAFILFKYLSSCVDFSKKILNLWFFQFRRWGQQKEYCHDWPRCIICPADRLDINTSRSLYRVKLIGVHRFAYNQVYRPPHFSFLSRSLFLVSYVEMDLQTLYNLLQIYISDGSV